MTGRTETITERVNTKFGTHYVHISHVAGRILDISISSPGKFDNSEIAGLLGTLSEAANQVIADIAGAARR